MYSDRIRQLYAHIIESGAAGTRRFYQELEQRNIRPMPDPARFEKNLYAPNPVIVDGTVIQTMTADANRFCDALRSRITTPEALLARAPQHICEHYTSPELLEQILDSLRQQHPFICLDAFLIETPDGLRPGYLEWQTVGTYITMGALVVEAAAAAWPEIRDYSSLTAWPNLSLDKLAQRLSAIYLQGIADDPRQGVIVDYCPEQCATRREFYAIQDLTGGPERGMGVIDPREIVAQEGRFWYRRNGQLIPIQRVYSRLVFSDLLLLEQEATADQLATIRRFFQSAEISWISHLVHFFYGSKADFPLFWQSGLSPAIPESLCVTPEFIAGEARRLATGNQLVGFVQKPIDTQSGAGVVLNPGLDQLTPGYILQREIKPVAYHQTMFGYRTPEIRIMALPDEHGRLFTGLMYNRIKSPEEFLSNAGHLARMAVPGTGEGYGIVVYQDEM